MRRIFGFLLLLSVVSAQAGLKTRLAASVQTSAYGRELVVRGSLTNTSTTSKIYLNDVAADFGSAFTNSLALDPNSFFSNVPGILLPNESYSTDELFRLVLSASTSAGDLGSTIVFRGGSDIVANNDLAHVSCRIEAPALAVGFAPGLGLDTAVFTFLRGDSSDGLLATATDSLGVSFIPAASGAKYIVEASTNLLNWSTVGVEEVTMTTPNPPTLRSYRYNGPLGPGSVFLRLRVVQN
ncbi:MAG: hypothetical protein ACR2HH_06875 [Chthoniobacterales bacterium]